jgi:hypothetical protein
MAQRSSLACSTSLWRAAWLASSLLAAISCKWIDPVETEDLCRQGAVVSMNCPQCRGPSYAGECPICQGPEPPSGCGVRSIDPIMSIDGSAPVPGDGTDVGTGGSPSQRGGRPSDGGPASGAGGMSGPSGGEAGGSASADNPPGCQDDSECIAFNAALPACDPISLECVECNVTDHCEAGVCDPNEHRCIQCTLDTDCDTGACYDARCVQCKVNEQCPDEVNDQCHPELHACVDCVDRSGCATGACDEALHVCVECLVDTDCPEGSNATCDELARKCVDCTQGRGCDEATNGTCLEGEQRCVDCLDDSGCEAGHCDVPEMVCVECTEDSHCGDELCEGNTCVECRGDDNCPDRNAARCDQESHECAACTEDSQCAHLRDTPVCSSGRCVECNDDRTCDGRSCIRSEHRCSDIPVGSLRVCDDCEADSMCASGMRCIPLSYDSRTVGHYCAWTRSSRGCASRRPYSRELGSVRSIDGTNEAHCGPPARTTCEGVRDAVVGQNGMLCPSGSSDECGAEDFDDALCVDGRCTYTCSNTNECPSELTCLANGSCG